MTTTTTTTITSPILSEPEPEPKPVDLSLKPSQASTFLTPNGGIGSHPPKFEFSDIEMISLHSLTYTSLKDILPSHRSPPGIMSPTNNSSWHEIPIKNPLVKHAALAYLQPMSFPPESDDRGLLRKLLDKCCCGGGRGIGVGCLAYFGEVVVQTLKQVFRERRESDYDDYEDYESDDDDDEDEDDKVD